MNITKNNKPATRVNPFNHPSVIQKENGAKTISAHSIEHAITYDYVNLKQINNCFREQNTKNETKNTNAPRVTIENLYDGTKIEIIKNKKDLYVVDTETLKNTETKTQTQTELILITEGVIYKQQETPNKALKLVQTKNTKYTNLEELTNTQLPQKNYDGMMKTYTELFNLVESTYKKHI